MARHEDRARSAGPKGEEQVEVGDLEGEGTAPTAAGRGASGWNKTLFKPDMAGMAIDQDPRETRWETAHRGTGAMAATVG